MLERAQYWDWVCSEGGGKRLENETGRRSSKKGWESLLYSKDSSVNRDTGYIVPSSNDRATISSNVHNLASVGSTSSWTTTQDLEPPSHDEQKSAKTDHENVGEK